MKRLLGACYRACLRLYPRPFRARYGEAMLADFENRLKESYGLRQVDKLVVWLLRDLLVSIPREHLRTFAPPRSTPQSPRKEPSGSPRRATAMWSTLVLDVRFALRNFLRQRSFTTLALVTIAIGVGATVTIFSLLYGVVLRPLPYANPEGIVRVWEGRTFSKQFLEQFQERLDTLELAAWSGWGIPYVVSGESEELSGMAVSGNYFELLGRSAMIGRVLQPDDGQPGAEPVAVISAAFWQSRLGGEPGIVGRILPFQDGDHRGRRVVGVLPPVADPLEPASQVWFPLLIDSTNEEDYTGSWYLKTLGRVRPGSSIELADQQVALVAHQLREEAFRFIGEDELTTAHAVPLRAALVADVRGGLLALFAAVAFVLLVACANVGSLLLARGAERVSELSIRATLGASRRRILRQLITESLVLGLAGGALGLLFAWLLLGWFSAHLPADLPRRAEVALDMPVLLFALVASTAASLLFGVVPAASAGRRLRPELSPRVGAAPRGHWNLQSTLVVLEVALAMGLLSSSGLLIKSYSKLSAVEPGFEVKDRVTLRIALPGARYPEERVAPFFEQVLLRVRGLPGVKSAAGNHLLPLTMSNWNFPYEAQDHPVPALEPPPTANYRVITPDYFRTLGIALRSGRAIEPADSSSGAKSVVINETMARGLWPNGDVLGKTLRLFRSKSLEYQVVGVVADTLQHRLDLVAQPEMYYSMAQRPVGQLYLVAHIEGDPEAALQAIRDAVLEIDSEVPVSEATTLQQVLFDSVAERRFLAQVFVASSALTLLLGIVGIYGVVAHTVARRRREMGIRLAVGARRYQILRGVLLRTAGLAMLGLAAGVGVSLFAGNRMASLLFSVTAHDPMVLLPVAAGLMAVAMLAATVPAWRAAQVDPATTLRD